jgi:acyl-homoserine-lactone acylase
MSPGATVTPTTPDVFHDEPGRLTTRGVRALQVLGANSRMTLDDAKALAMDETWVTSPDWIAALRWSIATRPDRVAQSSPDLGEAVARLLAFDGKAAANSEAAADFWFWRNAVDAPVAKLDGGAFVAWPWDASRFTPAFADVLLEGLDKSLAHRREIYGTTRQRLGDVMRFSRGTTELPGGGVSLDTDTPAMCLEKARAVCERTMRAFGVAPLGGKGKFRITRGSQSMRVVQFTNPIQAWTLYAFGQSDDPASPHYADQVALFSEGRMKPARFSRQALTGHVTSERTLTYAPPYSSVSRSPATQAKKAP